MKFLAAFAGLVGLAAADAATNVEALTKATWTSFLEENEKVLVEFYAPWCGHCKALEPEYNKASLTLQESSDMSKVRLAKVDATIEAELAEEHGIKGFPTMKWFVKGKPSEYDGGRTADDIVSWISKMTRPSITEGVPPADGKAPTLVLDAPELPEWFQSYADENVRSDFVAYWNKADETKLKLSHVGEDAIETDASGMDSDAVTAFVKTNKFPLYGSLTAETFAGYVDSGIGLVWILLPMEATNVKEVAEASREEMTKLAQKVSPDFNVAWTNTEEFKQVLKSMFSIETFPKVVVQPKAGDKKNFIYEEEMTADGIAEFVRKVKAGEVEAKLKSEEIPNEDENTPVKTIVGKTVETQVFTSDKDVLLEIYAPWCGHCKKLEPHFYKVGKKVIKEGFQDKVVIAKMDGTLNDSPVDSINWSGFPTIYFIKAGSSTPMAYDGTRDARGIWKWLKNKSTYAEEIKAHIAKKKEAKESGDESDEKKKEEHDEL